MLQKPALLALAILTFFCAQAHSVVQVIELDPSHTARGIRAIKGKHQVVFDSAVVQNDKLLITLAGTNSKPVDFSFVQTLGASLGYRSLGLDYPNTVIPTICQTRPERDCFDNYRSEIVLGRSVSPFVQVSAVNSIVNRIESLLAHLIKADQKSWQNFAHSDGSINWSKVVLVGHSQGAGHAAYIAKLFAVSGVVMTGGPYDKSGSGLASWLSLEGATPALRLSAFLHKQDFYGSDLQVDVIRELLNDPLAEVVQIDNAISVAGSAQIFMTDRQAADPHNALATSEYESVWRSLLQRF